MKDIISIVAIALLGVAGTAVLLGIVYLVWVFLSWGLITVVVAFGGTVGISPWELAVPLWVVSIIAKKLFSRIGV